MRTAKLATRMTASISVAVLLMVVATPPTTASSSELPPPPPGRTALLMGGTSIPTWRDADVEVIMNQFIGPTHAGTIEPVAVTTPQEGWPVTGRGMKKRTTTAASRQ